jgi:hypothetical protein
VPDNDRSDTPLPFTNEESFGLFVEGLRSLQQYEDATATEQPIKNDLDRTMQSALHSLRDCTSRYPADLLPFFYLGVTLSMKNQAVYVDRLVELTPEVMAFGHYLAFDDEAIRLHSTPPDESEADRAKRDAKRTFSARRAGIEKTFAQPFFDLAKRPWPLLEAASRLFERLSHDSTPPNPDLERAARYNWAQVLARRGSQEEQTYLSKALSVISSQHFDDIVELDHEVREKEEEHRELSQASVDFLTRLWPPALRKREREIADMLQDIRSTYETMALIYQFDALCGSLKLRIAAFHPGEEMIDAARDLELLEASIEVTPLFDPSFKADLLADYLTKTGYAKYEFASNRALHQAAAGEYLIAKALGVPDHVRPDARFFLGEAATDLMMALELKEHWNPAQIYLAFVRRIQAGLAEARSELVKYDKDCALAGDMKEKARTQHKVDDTAEQEKRATESKDSEERQRLGREQLKHLAELDRITAQITKISADFDRQIAEHDREKTRFSAEADELFKALQGFPSPTPVPSTPGASGPLHAPPSPPPSNDQPKTVST